MTTKPTAQNSDTPAPTLFGLARGNPHLVAPELLRAFAATEPETDAETDAADNQTS